MSPLAGWDRVWSAAGIAFVLALLGWMPIPLDVAAWHSLWTLERAKQTGHHPSVRHAVFDVRIGYIGATVLAALFLLLGALVMYGSGQDFPASAVGFSASLVDMYASSLGEWSRPLTAIAALTTMFSTTLAVTDAYPRAVRALIEVSGGLAGVLRGKEVTNLADDAVGEQPANTVGSRTVRWPLQTCAVLARPGGNAMFSTRRIDWG